MHSEIHNYDISKLHETDPEKYSLSIISSIGRKADRNKKMARNFTILSVLMSSLIVFVLIFNDTNIPTIIAAMLTIFNSVLIAWFQMEKPYERWRLYRKYHRLAEAQRMLYLNSIEPYNSSDKKTLLFKNFIDLQIKLHFEWDGLVPTSEEIKKFSP